MARTCSPKILYLSRIIDKDCVRPKNTTAIRGPKLIVAVKKAELDDRMLGLVRFDQGTPETTISELFVTQNERTRHKMVLIIFEHC